MRIYQVDAFAEAMFQGNPAAVIPLTGWLPETVMQNIAMENNLAETAFIVPRQTNAADGPADYDYLIRWFTPTVEVELCGHATLASGHVVVQPGESLWRIARHAYGQGVRYTVIFAANHDQIRDPDLIYPGQTFAVPKDGSAIPASASNSR